MNQQDPMNKEQSEVIETIMKHKRQVRDKLRYVAYKLLSLANHHDDSKLKEPELSMFLKYTPMLKKLEYGSKEYQDVLKEMGKELQHHYQNNRHHPECWKDGIESMSILYIIEMIADWATVAESTNIGINLLYQKERFNCSWVFLDLLQKIHKDLFDNYDATVVQDIIEKEFDHEVLSIVFDWLSGVSVDANDYAKPDKKKFERAKDYILMLISNGLG